MIFYSSLLGTFLVNIYNNDVGSALHVLPGSKTIQVYFECEEFQSGRAKLVS